MRRAYHCAYLCLGGVFLAILSGCPVLIPGQTNTFDGIAFQWCPPGTFMMGSPTSEVGRQVDETRHEVTISEGFWLGTCEVTQAQWVAVMGSNPLLDYFPPDYPLIGDDLPVTMVSWNDVQDFMAELNRRTVGATYQLPTEAEWEYACRAGTSTRFPWGDDPDFSAVDSYCWYVLNSGYANHPVGQKLSNAWGIHDMCGNVAEWCRDWYGDYPSTPVTDPQGAAPDSDRVGRGGSQQASPLECRPAWRGYAPPDGAGGDVGFRILRRADWQRPALFDLPRLLQQVFPQLPRG